MGVRRYFVFLLVLGFWLSVQGRMEPDFKAANLGSEFHSFDLTHQHNDAPQSPANPTGAHKDQHGCYHSHAPFVAAYSDFHCEAVSSVLVAAALMIPHSPGTKAILHPPRAEPRRFVITNSFCF